jgi:hypothetical protein
MSWTKEHDAQIQSRVVIIRNAEQSTQDTILYFTRGCDNSLRGTVKWHGRGM